MSIVCGVDFSAASVSAADVAAELAKRAHTELVLAHVLTVQDVYQGVRESMREAARLALTREAERLAASGVKAVAELREGLPDEALCQLAESREATTVVISALGERKDRRWQLGGSADRIAQQCTSPVIVVRDPEPFLLWLNGQRPLEVVVGVDRSAASRAALGFVQWLRSLAPVNVTALEVYWAAEEHRRLGLLGIRSVVDSDPEVEAALLRDLRQRVRAVAGEAPTTVEVELALGRASDHLVGFAQKRGAELIVVGSKRRNLVDRLWTGSTSRAVLRDARCSVACVTAPTQASEVAAPRVLRALVATDFSPTGDAAVRWAFDLVQPGGEVELVHVRAPSASLGVGTPRDIFAGPASPQEREQVRELERKLTELVPPDARERQIVANPRVVASSNVASAILQAAERLGAEAIILGTRGRTGLSRAVLGSAAQDVAAKSPRPVLLVHPPK